MAAAAQHTTVGQARTAPRQTRKGQALTQGRHPAQPAHAGCSVAPGMTHPASWCPCPRSPPRWRCRKQSGGPRVNTMQGCGTCRRSRMQPLWLALGCLGGDREKKARPRGWVGLPPRLSFFLSLTWMSSWPQSQPAPREPPQVPALQTEAERSYELAPRRCSHGCRARARPARPLPPQPPLARPLPPLAGSLAAHEPRPYPRGRVHLHTQLLAPRLAQAAAGGTHSLDGGPAHATRRCQQLGSPQCPDHAPAAPTSPNTARRGTASSADARTTSAFLCTLWAFTAACKAHQNVELSTGPRQGERQPESQPELPNWPLTGATKGLAASMEAILLLRMTLGVVRQQEGLLEAAAPAAKSGCEPRMKTSRVPAARHGLGAGAIDNRKRCDPGIGGLRSRPALPSGSCPVQFRPMSFHSATFLAAPSARLRFLGLWQRKPAAPQHLRLPRSSSGVGGLEPGGDDLTQQLQRAARCEGADARAD